MDALTLSFRRWAFALGLGGSLAFTAQASEPSDAPVRVGLSESVDAFFSDAQPVSWSDAASELPQYPLLSAGWLQQDVDYHFVAAGRTVRQPTPEPVQPVQPAQPNMANQPSARPVSTSGIGLGTAPDLSSSFSASAPEPVAAERAAIVQSSGPTSFVRGTESIVRQTTDAGDLLSKSTSAPGVYLQRRNPIVNSTFIRGYNVGQYKAYLNGAQWFPARQDLDTALGKIDSPNIQDIIIIKGPYSAQYGPGFAFFDVVSKPSPRFNCGPDSSFQSLASYNTNGQGWYGYQSASIGSCNWGMRVSYSQRTANDYDVGNAGAARFAANGGRIPSSYNSGVLDTAFGADLDADTTIETTFLHIDQTGLELPGATLDLNVLNSNAFTTRIKRENQCNYDLFVLDAYYNKTVFNGNTQRTGKFFQSNGDIGPASLSPPVLFSNIVNGNQISSGYKTAVSWGEPTGTRLTLGTDLRYMAGFANELDTFPSGINPATGQRVANNPVPTESSPIPDVHSVNPGVFEELQLKASDRFLVTTGGRLDYAEFNPETGNVATRNGAPINFAPAPPIPVTSQHFALGSGFITSKYDLNRCWTVSSGYGFAMRAPTFQELYSQGQFVQVVQGSYSRLRGNADLDAEKLHQVDLGIDGKFDRTRVGLHGYQSWINDYIYFQSVESPQAPIPGSGNQVTRLRYINLNQAQIRGFEAYGEYDYNAFWTLFGVAGYTYGTNRDLNQPLVNMYPLYSQFGVRLHQPCARPRWGMELSARALATQTRLGTTQIGAYAAPGTLPPGATFALEQRTPGFMTGDFRSYYRITDSATLTAGVTNLADRFYQEPLDPRVGRGVFQPGRSFYFGADFRF